ncbi:MAG: FHA domain-containing protein, partial [Deltaproteobacteria bacterium]|nr:FHA domain-containing protein [Deltaproteobacteria bacterium]
MARNGADDWDDDGRGKKSGGGTMALDVGKMEIDDKPSGRPGTRGGRGHDAGGGHGRSAALGRSPHQDDDDAVSSSGRARRGGGGKKGGDEWGSPGGFGKSSGTAALDVRGLELDGDRPAKNRRADWAQSGGKPKGRDLDDDDDPGYAKKGKGLVGSRRDSAVRLEPGEAEIDSGFHDWSTPKPASTSSPEQRAVGAAPASGEESTPAKLLVREPGKPDRLFPLHPKNRSWIVGREISCDLVLSDIKSSRQHFEITFLGGVFSLKDLGSGNGTKVDGEKVSRVQLSGGSIVTVGDCELVFQLDQQALNRLQEREKPG